VFLSVLHNHKRPLDEVRALFGAINETVTQWVSTALKIRARITVVGERDIISEEEWALLDAAIAATKHNNK
jgi:undecaprenyl pyrophosphate synthase